MTASHPDGRSPGGAPPVVSRKRRPAHEASGILDALDVAIVLCDETLTFVAYANREGTRVLATFAGPEARLPVRLRAALGVRTAAALPTERFTRAVPVTAPTGQHYYARARRLADPAGGALIVVTLDHPRQADLCDTLGRVLALSRRQCELVTLVCAGLRDREVARRLAVTEGTVRQYLVEIYQTLGVHSRGQLAALVEHAVAGAEAERARLQRDEKA